MSRIYRKTERARAELAARTRQLPARLRAVLILVDGRSSVQELVARLGQDAPAALEDLLGGGYIEALPAPRVAARVPMPAPEVDERLAQARRHALARLTPHFGPDVRLVAKALMDATDARAYNAGLDGIERKLAIYMGKAQAAREVAGLRLREGDLR